MFFKKNRVKILASVAALALVLGTGGYQLIAQPSAPFYFPLPTHRQVSLRYNDTVSPIAVEGGCEVDEIGIGAVNGFRIQGGLAGSPITVTAFPCTGPPAGDANIGITLAPAGAGSVTFGGTSGSNVAQQSFFSAPDVCRSDNALLIPVRVAANDFALARTAAGAETYNINCSLQFGFRTTANKGVRVDSIIIVYQVLTASLTSHTFTNMATRTFANNVANAVAQYGGAPTISLATATQANPYSTTGTFATPVFMNTTNTEVNIEWQAVMQNTGVYRVYGVLVNFTQALY